MRKLQYTKPMFLGAFTTDPFDIIPSQQGQGSGYDLTEWNEWWSEWGEMVRKTYPNFFIEDSRTWPQGFDPNDSETWERILLGWD